MNKVFIIDLHKNPGLLRFTETKVFFGAKNQSLDWAYDCEVVDSIDQITEDVGIVINSGEFVSTNFRLKYPRVSKLVDARGDPDLIQFTPDYSYSIKKQPPYEQGSKQLYILENLYKVILRSEKLVYLDNTENHIDINISAKHFYGLASGWKSVKLIKQLGIESLDTITIYDKCVRQLEYQQYLHSCSQLPSAVNVDPPVCGEYCPSDEMKEFWPLWHKAKVEFKIIDLFQTPVFPEDSFVWISNVFKYEPAIFEFGWQECKTALQRLCSVNKSSIIKHI